MANNEFDDCRTDSSDEICLSSSSVLEHIETAQYWLDELLNASNKEEESDAAFELHHFLDRWHRAVEVHESRQRERPLCLWARLFGGKAKAVPPVRSVDDDSKSELTVSFERGVPSARCNRTTFSKSISSSSTSSVREIRTVSSEEGTDAESEPSLRQGTCEGVGIQGDRSPTAVSTDKAISESWDSVTLTSDKESDLATSRSDSASTEQSDGGDVSVTQHEDQTVDYAPETAKAQELLNKLTAIFGGSEDGDEDVLFHHEQVGDKSKMRSASGGSTLKNSAESGQSTRFGLRQLFSVFSRSSWSSK